MCLTRVASANLFNASHYVGDHWAGATSPSGARGDPRTKDLLASRVTVISFDYISYCLDAASVLFLQYITYFALPAIRDSSSDDSKQN